MEPVTDPGDSLVAPTPPGVLDQPRGLWVLAGTELCDRISWYGMASMLVLYMTGDLLRPERIAHVAGFATYRAGLERVFGQLGDTGIATETFSLYFAAITFLPLVGGWLGDRWVNRRLAVCTGALVMTAGHFCMAFDATFLLALVLLVLGAGLLRGNLVPQIRALYAAGDRRLGDAFQIYAMSVNLGAFIAPVIAGTLARFYGWHAGFAFAGIAMLAGMAGYLAGARHLPLETPRASRPAHRPLDRAERRHLLALALLWPCSVAFWTVQAEIWNVYNVWARDHVAMHIGSFAVPVPWLQSLDGLAPALFGVVLLLVWRGQAERGIEPEPVHKLAIGCLIFALGTALLGLAPLVADGDGLAPLWLPVCFHLLSNIGAVFFAPVIQGLYAGHSPERWRGTMNGVFALSVSVGGLVSGPLGNWYGEVSAPLFWITVAAIDAVAGLLLLVAARPIGALTIGPARVPSSAARPALKA